MENLNICSNCFVVSYDNNASCKSCDFGTYDVIASHTHTELAKIFKKKLCPICLEVTQREKITQYYFKCSECDWTKEDKGNASPPICHVCQTEARLINSTEVDYKPLTRKCQKCHRRFKEKLYSQKPKLRANSEYLEYMNSISSLKTSKKARSDLSEPELPFYVCDLCDFGWEGPFNHCPRCDTICSPSSTPPELYFNMMQSREDYQKRHQRDQGKLAKIILIGSFLFVLVLILNKQSFDTAYIKEPIPNFGNFMLLIYGFLPLFLALRALKSAGEVLFAVIFIWISSFGTMFLAAQLFEYGNGEIHTIPLLVGLLVFSFSCLFLIRLGNEKSRKFNDGFDGHESDVE